MDRHMDCPPCFGRVRLRVGRVERVLIGTFRPWTADTLGSLLLFVVSQDGVPLTGTTATSSASQIRRVTSARRRSTNDQHCGFAKRVHSLG